MECSQNLISSKSMTGDNLVFIMVQNIGKCAEFAMVISALNSSR